MMMPVGIPDNNGYINPYPHGSAPLQPQPQPQQMQQHPMSPMSPMTPMTPQPFLQPQQQTQWDWNKLFVPMQQVMNQRVNVPHKPPPTETDDFKYASPFAKTTKGDDTVPEESTLNPMANSFKMPFLQQEEHETPAEKRRQKQCAAAAEGAVDERETMATSEKEAEQKCTKKKRSKADSPNEETLLAMHGYKKLKKLTSSLQGTVYLGETIPGHEIVKQLKIASNKKRRVVIKKTLKALHKERITKRDGMNIVVDEDVVREAIILHHLTVDNSPAGSSICKLLSFFESSTAYYVVLEYAGSMTLKQFVDKAHRYIKQKKLDLAHWKKICKYLAWQIAATLYWMHVDMNCVHLDLTLENIVVQHGKFIEDEKTGAVTIDRNVSCKVCDFGLAEVIKVNPGDEESRKYFEYNSDEGRYGAFHINTKYSTGTLSSHASPEVFNEQVYDGRKSDIWNLGIILFYMTFGIYPYEKQLTTDSGFWACKHQKLDLFIDMSHLSHLFNPKLVSLIQHCLNTQEAKRADIQQVVTDSYFKTYYKRYALKIKEQSCAQIEKTKEQQANKSDINIPYYQHQK